MKILVNITNAVYDLKDVEVISKGILVRQEGYGKEAVYIPKEDTVDFTVIQDRQLITDQAESVGVLSKRLEKVESEKSAEWLKAYNAENENKKLKEELATLKGLCPHKETT